MALSFVLPMSTVWLVWNLREKKSSRVRAHREKEFVANNEVDCFVCEKDDRLKVSRLLAENNDKKQFSSEFVWKIEWKFSEH